MSHGGQSSNPRPAAPILVSDLDEDDDISITSTVPDEEREYEVEEVVYQLPNEEGVMLYLVKWAGYDDVENTWEPETSFIDPSTLKDWEKKQDAVSEGLETEFDIEAWHRRKRDYEVANEAANAKRRSRRKAKRKLLGLPVSVSSDSELEFSYAMDPLDAARSSRSRGHYGETDYEESEYTSMREQPSRLRGSRDSSLSSTDSLMEDLKRKAAGRGTDRQNLEQALRLSKDLTKPSHDKQTKQASPKKVGVVGPKKPDLKKPGTVLGKRPIQTTPRKAIGLKAAAIARPKEPIEKPSPARKVTITKLGPAKEVLAAAGIRTTFAPMRKTTGAANANPRIGSGKLAKRTGHSSQHTTAPGRGDVLQNWTNKPRQRKTVKPAVGRPRSPEQRLYKNLATKRRAELRGRKEATPDINKLDLILPGASHRSLLPKPPTPVTNLSSSQRSDGLDSLFEDKGLGDEGNPMLIDEEPLQYSPTRGNENSNLFVVGDDDVEMQEADAPNDTRPGNLDRNVNMRSPESTLVGSNEQSTTDRNQSPVHSTITPNMSPSEPPSLGTSVGPVFWADLLGPVKPKPAYDALKLLKNSGRYWDPGDLLVTMRIFEQMIGDVRLRGLESQSKAKIYRMKENHNIDITLASVITIDDYKSLVIGRSNPIWCNGWVEGFDDTHAGCDQLATFLKQHGLAAVWNHPHEDLSLLVYHHTSSDWEFLDAATFVPIKTPLRVAARPRLPSFQSSKVPPAPPVTIPPPPTPPPPVYNRPQPPAKSIPGRQTSNSIPPPPSPTRPEEDMLLSNSFISEGVASNSCENVVATRDPRRNKLGPNTAEMAALSNQELDTVFQSQLGIDFDKITKLRLDNVVAEKFLLVFPHGTESEGQQFERFLRFHGAKKIFLDGDRLVKWREFSAGDEPSCLVLHVSFPFIDRLPSLAGLLNKRLVVWRVSLNSPIPYDENERHLNRIFPQGGAMFITEDLMVNDTHKALQIIRWFCRKYYPQRLPNTWKLVFRPRIREWLFDMYDKTEDRRFLEIRKELDDLIPEYPITHHNYFLKAGEIEDLDGVTDDEGQVHPFVSFSNLPKYGSRKEDDHKKVPKGLTQEERNKDHLMEFFAGWAIGKIEEFRRFIVISRLPHLDRWKKWHHLRIQTPDEFANTWKITLGFEDPDLNVGKGMMTSRSAAAALLSS